MRSRRRVCWPGTNSAISVILAGLSGEEQGLWGGQHMARVAGEEGWEIIGVLNNDMIGNIEGVDGVVENNTFRVFSEPTPVTDTEAERRRYRVYGGEVDGPSGSLPATWPAPPTPTSPTSIPS